MRFYLCFIVFFNIVFSINGYDASVCTGLHIDMAAYIPAGYQYVFKYSTDITLAAADESHTTLSFANQNTWSLDKKNYYQSAPIHFLNDLEVVKCSSVDGSCTLKVYDSLGLLQIPLSFDNLKPTLNKNVFFDQGTAFLTDSQNFQKTTFFNKSSPCVYTDGFPTFSKKNVESFLDMEYGTAVKYCCTQFNDLPLPDTQLNCQQLDGSTVLTNANGNLLADFSYFASTDYMDGNVTVNQLTTDSRFIAFLNYKNIKECDYYSSDLETCALGFQFDDQIDIQGNLQLSVLSNDFSNPTYGPIIAGKIIFRNGLFLKNQNELYTPNAPCWNRSVSLPNGAMVKNSLCCSKFHSICNSYESTTNLTDSNASAYLYLTYYFDDQSFILNINSYVASQASTVTVKSFSHDLSTQTCQTSTFLPPITCTFKLSKTHAYDISFSTTLTSKDYSIVTIVYDGTQVTSPSIGTGQLCQRYIDNWTQTQFCCSTNDN